MRRSVLFLSCFGGLVACSLANSPADPVTSTSSSSGTTSTTSTGACTGGDQKQCGDDCVNTMTDAAHCGGCDQACSAGQTCSEGKCEGASCTDPEVSCLGECVDLLTHNDHCGGCEQPCTNGDVCVNGSCSADCPEGWEKCGEMCVDTKADTNHCGGCDKPCGDGEECASGVCQCPQGTVACANSCVDTSTDLSHCGKCDNACSAGANATVACLMGNCNETCNKGFDDCSANLPGCETNLTSDLQNCGKCGNPCPSVSNGVGECKASACGIASCNKGYDDCDMQQANGCEADLDNDSKNCGMCKYDCGVGNYCSGGSCKTITSCDWNQGLFPFSWGGGNSLGDITFDNSCNIYIVSNSANVYRILYNTSSSTTLTAPASSARGVVFNPNDGLLYVAAGSSIYSMTTNGGSPKTLATVGGSLTGMTIAPAGWGSYGGYLVVGRSDGAVVAVNTNNATYKTLGTTSGVVSDVEFGGQVLYLAAYNQSKVLSLSPGGSFTTTASLTCNVDGLAVEPGVRVFAACGSNDEIYSSPLPAGTPKLVGKATLSGGWAPAGIIWDGKDTLIAMAESPYQLVALSP